MASAQYQNKADSVDYAFNEISVKELNDPKPMMETTNYANYFKLTIFSFLVVIGIGAITLGLVANLESEVSDLKWMMRINKIEKVDTTIEIPMAGEAGAHIANLGPNVCAGKKPAVGAGFDNFECVQDNVVMALEQAGANVTKGYRGGLDVGDRTPITDHYYKHGMCPVNVHWHLGAEHLSVGQFDEHGKGPSAVPHHRRLLAEEGVRGGFQCHHYDSHDAHFAEYDWKHCVGMQVGQTYEVHWPHSALGACGTPNQYQTPFYDGVFCGENGVALTSTHEQIGVQGQVFTIINDDKYYYPDLIRGMIVDGDMGTDIAMYTGSTTGTSRDNTICSAYTPITWQVDRKCHLISASSFDKMCADMKAQRDDMSDDLHAHGSRELVADHLAANNQQNK